MKYVEQSYEELRLILSRGKTDLAYFDVVSEAHFSINGFKVHFGILAESHFVIIESKETILNEIFACSDTEVPMSNVVFINELVKEKITERYNSKYEYKFEARIEELSAVQKEKMRLRAKRSQINTHYLELSYPTLSLDEEAPVTEIYITTTDKLHIETIHTYPNENIAVFSESILSPINL